uniref:ferroxidase n=1 Tax=Eutreptiella gymnastica TaxID=73025 RepID=A0A7S1NTD8_9EUGL
MHALRRLAHASSMCRRPCVMAPVCKMPFSISAVRLAPDYLQQCDDALESIHNVVDELSDGKLSDHVDDIIYDSGVLSIQLKNVGTYVLNRQAPNKQIWLSSPVSGPYHYDMVCSSTGAVRWLDTKDQHNLGDKLRKEFKDLYGDDVEFFVGES